MSKERLYIFDTTLRDGAQTHGVDFNVDEKKIIANKLDNLGVDYVEGGWPSSFNIINTKIIQFISNDFLFIDIEINSMCLCSIS